jgi:hypothetical protein
LVGFELAAVGCHSDPVAGDDNGGAHLVGDVHTQAGSVHSVAAMLVKATALASVERLGQLQACAWAQGVFQTIRRAAGADGRSQPEGVCPKAAR